MRLWKAVTAAAFFVALILSSVVAQQPAAVPQGIAWQADIATAQQLAGQSGKMVLVHFWAPWCKPCMKLEQEVFSRPETAQALNTNFVCVKINTDEAGDIAKSYNVTSLPTDVVLTKEGRLIAQLQCPQAANQYIQQIGQVAEGYKQLSNQLVAEAGRASDYASQLRGQFANSAAALGAAAPSVPVTNVAAQVPAAAPPAGAVAPAAAPPAGSSSTQGEAVSAYSSDRYADYFRSRQETTQETVNGSVTGAGTATTAIANAAADYGSRYAPPAAAQAPPAAAPSAQSAVAATVPPQAPTAPSFPPQVPAVAEQRSPVAAPQAPAIQLPPGSPPLVLDGYCTVQLKEQKRWVAGDRRWGAVHRGRTYLFTGPEEQKKFLENPDMYAPVISGNDPVLALDNGQAIPGRREHGVFYENRIYLFADEASLGRFYQNPNRYAAEVVQAMR